MTLSFATYNTDVWVDAVVYIGESSIDKFQGDYYLITGETDKAK